MKTSTELRQEIQKLQVELAKQLKKEENIKISEAKQKFTKMDSVFSMESDGIHEFDTTYTVFHNGLDFDFSQTLSERDSDGRRSLLFELEEQGLCQIIEK